MKEKLGIIIGVGPGLGLSLTRKFCRKGFKMVMIARRQEALDEYVSDLANEKLKAAGYAADVGDFNSLKNTLNKIHEEQGDCTLLMYNVSILNPGAPSEIDIESFINDFKVNVAGLLAATQVVSPQMEGNNDSMILVTGGGLALNPFYEYASLSVGKAGIRSLTSSIAQELKTKGIRVGSVIINGMIEKGTHFDPDSIAEEFWKLYQDENRKMEKEYIYN